jgi:single-stranded-DNA-specific exonuclease
MAKTGYTLQEKHKRDLENALKLQMGIGDQDLYKWATSPYLADPAFVSEFWKHIEEAPMIRIVGDYDCDGICASHIMSTAIKSVYKEKRVSVRIPRRFSEGYGINEQIADEIIETLPKGSLIITVDNGIAAADCLEKIRKAGYTVIVTDHHELRDGCRIPDVDMIIDPAVPELLNPLDGNYWCGAGVAYKLCEGAVDEKLASDLSVYAGLATIADCMQLKEGNWGLVRRSVKAFRDGLAPDALCHLLSGMKQDPRFINEDAFGFYLGPAFNAPGRLYDKGAIEVLKYLANPTAQGCAWLIETNEKRKALRDKEYKIVKEHIDTSGLSNTCPIWVALPGLHEGIVGILAGKVAEEYKKPAIVLTNAEGKPGILKGSARSCGTFNIFQYLSSIGGLFERMGGHAGAAGLSLTEGNFSLAKKEQIPLSEIGNTLEEKGLKFLIRQWEIPAMKEVLDKYLPYGEGNPAPVFEVEVNVAMDGGRMIGSDENHLLIQDKYDRYKLTHFFHTDSGLSDLNHFGMRGHICGSAFNGKETPTLNGEEVFDLVDEKERGR